MPPDHHHSQPRRAAPAPSRGRHDYQDQSAEPSGQCVQQDNAERSPRHTQLAAFDCHAEGADRYTWLACIVIPDDVSISKISSAGADSGTRCPVLPSFWPLAPRPCRGGHVDLVPGRTTHFARAGGGGEQGTPTPADPCRPLADRTGVAAVSAPRASPAPRKGGQRRLSTFVAASA